MDTRYYVNDTIKTLKTLGFQVRDPEGATTIFCIHKLTKQEVWIPKDKGGFLEDHLITLFKPLELNIVYFKSVYISLHDDNKHPSDQL